MALFDGIENQPPLYERCPVLHVLRALPADDAAGLRRALALPPAALSAPRIRDVLRDAGHEITSEPIARHRRGACKCVQA